MMSWLLFFYSLQVLITIWKELNGTDKYTPFVTPGASGSSFSAPSQQLHYLKESDTRTTVNDSMNENTGNTAICYSWE